MPAVSLCTDAFTAAAGAMARVQGHPDFPYAVLPHPLASLDRDGVAARADAIVPRVLAILGVPDA
ncbi:hypothetical protein Acsp06_40520 [Actinomycetospora sp. NBRC 106375]|uniref:UGSC family (seleno)protein n=1 Tax=Actinomycetospora sp. NBRC 106375 TaxID=3032207 RepID=UPI0024A07708|nr:hypothetical protein [Actinomycetospora sp. NBRC 106375]GLZ47867.1 hypothetical protein Acsp06_40520 [Actinomycetospora sp. NBRC 106375]